jgi:glycosyltransferase involved in cell wall biosynthesis
MDWLPNIDGMRYFFHEILPIIRKSSPDCRVTIVGRTPTAEIRQMSERDPLIEVTGTVPDVRPYLWQSAVSIVPLRIGGGTRMKIYEAMAARIPVVSTTIGAEGLEIHPPHDIRIADEPESFARECLDLLQRRDTADQVAGAAWNLVAGNFGWRRVADRFEAILKSAQVESLVRS